ncbi:MAG: hypothetical protein RIQ53_1089 [Pseudomonadota bacterium]
MTRPRSGPLHASLFRSLVLASPVLAVILLAAPARAGDAVPRTIWRCGDSYSHQPCPTDAAARPAAGARSLAVTDALTPERQREARAVATREQALVARWARERAQAWREAGSGLSGVGPAPAPDLKRPKASRPVEKKASAAPRPGSRSASSPPRRASDARTSPSAAGASPRAQD